MHVGQHSKAQRSSAHCSTAQRSHNASCGKAGRIKPNPVVSPNQDLSLASRASAFVNSFISNVVSTPRRKADLSTCLAFPNFSSDSTRQMVKKESACSIVNTAMSGASSGEFVSSASSSGSEVSPKNLSALQQRFSQHADKHCKALSTQWGIGVSRSQEAGVCCLTGPVRRGPDTEVRAEQEVRNPRDDAAGTGTQNRIKISTSHKIYVWELEIEQVLKMKKERNKKQRPNRRWRWEGKPQ